MRIQFIVVLLSLAGVLVGQRCAGCEPEPGVWVGTMSSYRYGTYAGLQVQVFLLNSGYNPGPIDGIIGPRTQAAIDAFRKDHNQIIADQTVMNVLAGK